MARAHEQQRSNDLREHASRSVFAALVRSTTTPEASACGTREGQRGDRSRARRMKTYIASRCGHFCHEHGVSANRNQDCRVYSMNRCITMVLIDHVLVAVDQHVVGCPSRIRLKFSSYGVVQAGDPPGSRDQYMYAVQVKTSDNTLTSSSKCGLTDGGKTGQFGRSPTGV